MSEFDSRARVWDSDKMHVERSTAIAEEIEKILTSGTQKALEFGGGTGMLSFMLKDKFSDITIIDSSKEMINVCLEKCEFFQTKHIKPLWFDLELDDLNEKYDIIYCQMVLHHVKNTDAILNKFSKLLNKNGILVIADLYSEDGSFHGTEVDVHHGFEPDELIKSLESKGFANSSYKTCFTVRRPTGVEYPVFFLTSKIK